MILTFVKTGESPKRFGYDGVKSIDVDINHTVSIKGIDSITERGYVARISAHEYSYFTVHKEDKENE